MSGGVADGDGAGKAAREARRSETRTRHSPGRVEAMDLEAQLTAWMEEHEGEILDLLDEEMDRFREHHPGIDDKVAESNALLMANRRFIVRALGAVLPGWLKAEGSGVGGQEQT